MTRIGVLALQGDFFEHIKILRSLDVDALEIRLPAQLDSIDGLIIPGGESTTIVQLIDIYKFIFDCSKSKEINIFNNILSFTN